MKKLLILSAALLFSCSQPTKTTHYGHVIERWIQGNYYNMIWYDEESGKFRTFQTQDVNYYSTYQIGDIICVTESNWE